MDFDRLKGLIAVQGAHGDLDRVVGIAARLRESEQRSHASASGEGHFPGAAFEILVPLSDAARAETAA